MGSSARLFDNHCGMTNSGLVEEIGSVTFCRRCQLGIALGIMCTLASTVVVGLKLGMNINNKAAWLFTGEMMLSGMMAGSQAVGVTFLTSQEGPGAPLNNLYYSSWGALLVGILLVASCVEDYSTASGVVRSEANGGHGEREGFEMR